MVRYSMSALITLLALMPAATLAKTPITCGGAIDAAEKADIDWTTTGAKGFWAIDGGSIKTMDALRDAMIAAKRNIPVVIGGDFSGWDFRDLTWGLSGSCFSESNFQNSKWDGAELFGIGFVKADLSGASFNNSTMEYVLLRGANLGNTSMRAANLKQGRLDGGWDGNLENWDVTAANLTNFVFECGITIDDGCALDRGGVKFSGANMTGAEMSTLPFWGQADYYGAILNQTILSPRQIVDVKGADIRGPIILKGGERKVKLTAQELATLQEQVTMATAANDRPSFDCGKASNAGEKAICNSDEQELRRLDRKMAEIYSFIRPKNPAIAPEQKAWLASRNRCNDSQCLSDLYSARIDVLVAKLGEPDLLARGQSALYITDEIPFPNAFRDTPLFAKITPVIVGSSMAQIILSRGTNGSYTAAGSSVGANAHSCSLAADGLRFDPKSGWFAVEDAPVVRVVGDEMEIIANGHPDYETQRGSSEYVSCGARALFDTMRPIKVDAAVMAAERKALETIGM